jgi:spore coat polysaccharide biosynthesis predicted glycosyltransferase SpsG
MVDKLRVDGGVEIGLGPLYHTKWIIDALEKRGFRIKHL